MRSKEELDVITKEFTSPAQEGLESSSKIKKVGERKPRIEREVEHEPPTESGARTAERTRSDSQTA